MKITTYETVKQASKGPRGRAPLPPPEKARRMELRKLRVRRRAEATRRAHYVLQHKYPEEFAIVFNEEFERLAEDSRYSNL